MLRFLFERKKPIVEAPQPSVPETRADAMQNEMNYLIEQSLPRLNYRAYAAACELQPSEAKNASSELLQEYVLLSPAFYKNYSADRAARFVVDDIQCGLQSPFVSTIYNFGDAQLANIDQFTYLLRASKNTDLVDFFEQRGIPLTAIINTKILAQRSKDLHLIYETLENKKKFFLPLLMMAKASSVDKYGETDLSKWFSGISDFSDRFFPEDKMLFFRKLEVLCVVSAYVENWIKHDYLKSADVSSGLEFEVWCAEQLKAQGWQTRLTKASGDQGVDVIAQREDVSVAIQCKKYSKPVSNKAVQEILAGKTFVSATEAAVIATGGFTKGAIEIAKSAAVDLIHADQMALFSQKYGFESEATDRAGKSYILQSFSLHGEKIIAALYLLAFDVIDLHILGVSKSTRDDFFSRIVNAGETEFALSKIEAAKLIEAAELMLTSELTASFDDEDYVSPAVLFLRNIGIPLSSFETTQSQRLDEVIGDAVTNEVRMLLHQLAQETAA